MELEKKNHKIISTQSTSFSKIINCISSYHIGHENKLSKHFTDSLKDPFDVMNKIIKEGFADLYANVLIGKIYSKEQAIDITQACINARENARQNNKENYWTDNLLKKYLKDYKENIISLPAFEDLITYIETKTTKESQQKLIEQICPGNEKMYNGFLGIMAARCNLSTNNAKETYEYLVNQCNFPNLAIREDEAFMHLKNLMKQFMVDNSTNNLKKLTNRIEAMRNTCSKGINPLKR